MQCEDYAVTLSNQDLRIFLDKRDLIKSPEDVSGVIFSLKKIIYDEKNNKKQTTNLKFNICISNFNNKVLEILNKTKKANIVVLENEKLLYVLEGIVVDVV
tara:strand:+ start:1499 stop:1801 length:303 start_codon:yes stop_codon:yes gene_type:complete